MGMGREEKGKGKDWEGEIVPNAYYTSSSLLRVMSCLRRHDIKDKGPQDDIYQDPKV